MSSATPDAFLPADPSTTSPDITHQQGGSGVLVIGDSHGQGGAIGDTLQRHGYQAVIAGSLADGAASVTLSQPALVLIDVDFAGPGALPWCEQLKRDSATRLLPILALTAETARRQRLELLRAGVDAVLAQPIDSEELLARVKAAAKTSQFVNDLESAASIIMTLTAMLEAREASPGHCHRMANYAMALGRAIDLGDTERRALYRGAFLHDIGMLAIPDTIMRKGGPLAPGEYEVIKSHPVVGDALCANLRSLHAVRPIVRHHHERRDGSGYPDQLRGDDVPLLAQIVGIVDVFEAITTGRSYTAPRSSAEAVRTLRTEVELGWRRRDLVETFAGVVQKGDLDHGANPADLLTVPGTRPTVPR
jgi:putative two-component system response regulator